MANDTRPLSPHLQIYKTQITMVMSILHRITGVALYFGFALLTWWIVASAMGGNAQQLVNQVMGHWLAQVIMFGFTWALFNHMLGGIRHFIWDSGKGFSRVARFGFAWATLLGGFILTVLVWAYILWS